MAAAERPVVLVTGASSGVGLETAVAAARDGFTVVATMRDPSHSELLRKAAAEAGVEIDVRQLDVTDADSVETCLRKAVAAHGRLDALVNNAGVAATVPTIEMCPMERYRAGFEVNFFGTVAVTKAAMPHLRATGGRVVTVGSTRGLIGQPFNECYGPSKFAVEGLMECLAPTAAAMGVTVVLVVPGPVLGTEFAANSGVTRESLTAESGPYAEVLEAYLDWSARTGHPGALTGRETAEVVVDALVREDPPLRVMACEWAREYASRKLVEPEGRRVLDMTSSWLARDGG